MVLEELRRQLEPAVKRSSEHPLVSEDEQIAIVNSLRDRFTHSITLVCRDSEVSRPENTAVNCYEFALGLFEHPRYWEILNRARYPIPAMGLLVEDLIAAGLERLDSSREDVLLVYGRDCVGHVGRVRGHAVRSKWSPGGCVWDHLALEVPETYGRLWGYYAAPPIEQTLRIFEEEMSGICKRALDWYKAP
jgi:hypothetical protein